MKEKCIIFTGGTTVFCDGFSENYFKNCFVIAADSGCAQIALLNQNGFDISPNILLGDMDSFDRKTATETFPKAEFLSFPPEKDYTDTQLAVDVAVKRGYKVIEIVGGTGNRADHFLANLALLRKCRNSNVTLSINDGKNKIFYCESGDLTIENDKKLKYFSILPDDTNLSGVTITGAKFPLENAFVDRNTPISVSNEIVANKCNIKIKQGSFFLILCSD